MQFWYGFVYCMFVFNLFYTIFALMNCKKLLEMIQNILDEKFSDLKVVFNLKGVAILALIIINVIYLLLGFFIGIISSFKRINREHEKMFKKEGL